MTVSCRMAGFIACGLLAIAIAPHRPARAESRALNGQCARADVAAVAWIDAQVQRRSMPPPLLAEAALRVLQARNACMHGRVSGALEAYQEALRFAAPIVAGPDPAGR